MQAIGTWLLRPFEKIAGWPALSWGVTGMAVSTVLSYYSGYHYHGLMHFGPAPNDAWWVYAVEHLVVWLVPALLFWLGGLILSGSRIRPIDVFGTVAFAQLPLLGMNAFNFLPAMQRLKAFDINLPVIETMEMDRFASDLFLMMLGFIFFVWMLIWMFNALKVSCNLKGGKLWAVYLVSIIGGDILCRIIISSFY